MARRCPRVALVRLRRLAAVPALLLAASLIAPVASASAGVDLSVAVVSPATTAVGSYLYYTITATNRGSDTASNVVISDHTPSSMWAAHPTTFYCVGSGTAWCGSLTAGVSCTSPPVDSPGLVSCTAASLPPSTSLSITMVVHVGLYMYNQIVSDTATVASDSVDPTPADNTATVWARVI